MHAALPIRDENIEDPKELTWEYNFQPSREATKLRPLTVKNSRKRREYEIRPSELWDPLTSAHETQVTQFQQGGYLDVMQKLVLVSGRLGGVLSKPWLRELTRVCEDLRRQRNIMSQARQGHIREFVYNWDFRIPTYDQTMVRFAGGAWVDVP
jgi:hypothetical protein